LLGLGLVLLGITRRSVRRYPSAHRR